MFTQLLKGLEEQKSSGLLVSRFNYLNCNPEVGELLVPSLPLFRFNWLVPWKLVTGPRNMKCGYWGCHSLSCQPELTQAVSSRGQSVFAPTTLAAPESRLAVVKFPSSTRMGWEWKVLPVASAWETAWLPLAGLSKVFGSKRVKIRALSYRRTIKCMHHLRPCE